jgi:hypothetical protein
MTSPPMEFARSSSMASAGYLTIARTPTIRVRLNHATSSRVWVHADMEINVTSATT